MGGLALRAHAKLNLYLAVRARRPDGYHDIETVYHAVALADGLTIEPADTLSVVCDPPLADSDGMNLAERAARELAEDAGASSGARITISKNVPEAAGMGGGSADAAATLVGLNEAWGLRLSRDHLKTVAGAVGADVPFMIGGGAAIGRGRGDCLEPIAPWPGLGVVLALPKRRLSTAEVYAGSAPVNGGAPVQGAAAAVCARSLTALGELMRNDLTAAALATAPEIGVALDAASKVGVPALMSGSGPTVFGLGEDAERLDALEAAWKTAGLSTMRTRLGADGAKIV